MSHDLKNNLEKLTVLWRGTLESCNYDCHYCPFAKTRDDRPALQKDKQALARFALWARTRPYPVSILFTPWGEGLIHRYYRETIMELSHAPSIQDVAIQTNLSCSVDWVKHCALDHAAFWISWHPDQTPYKRFIEKIYCLEDMGVRYSVGAVGIKQHFAQLEALRQALPEKAYFWINAYKDKPDYYSEEDLAFLTQIDPLFLLNYQDYSSYGKTCHTGDTVISVLADGTASRCHFIKTPLGNIFEQGFENCLKPRPCSASLCDCHIGFSHLAALDFKTLFGRGFLERRLPM